ncbi:hypothetical protein [Aureivirga marina]|uniref:hypothetical protein n=1 Tax=Aureivirga marina TaxID=1182451 RepID=UPI0018C97726|nr:hypothetical protein [Aureivirga marina]
MTVGVYTAMQQFFSLSQEEQKLFLDTVNAKESEAKAKKQDEEDLKIVMDIQNCFRKWQKKHSN